MANRAMPSADLVRNLLLSDDYWQIPSSPLSQNKWPGQKIPVTETPGMFCDSSLAYDIGSLFLSASKECTITPVQEGEDLPVLHPRQFLKLILDRCSAEIKYNPHYIRQQYQLGKTSRWAKKKFGFGLPTFEEGLEAIYAVDLPTIGYAEVSEFHLVFGRIAERRVFYARPDPQTDQYAAISALRVNHEAFWNTISLHPIPKVKAGQVFSRRELSASKNRGRIVSAEIVEVNHVDWKLPPGPPSEPKKRKYKSSRLGEMALNPD